MSHWPQSAWLAAIVAALLSALGLGILGRVRRHLPLAHPVDRSLHARPVTRVGGLAIWAGFLPIALFVPVPMAGGAAWLVAWAAIAIVSIADDWRAVRPAIRLGVQALAALVVAAAMFGAEIGEAPRLPGAVAIGLAALAFVWAANLFNFMDGSDGVAAVMALCGFGAYGAAALRSGASPDAYFALAAATLPFLAVNLPPAKTFMGDCGAVPLGFLAAVFGLAGTRAGTWPAWFPLLVFLPFIADTLVTIIRRAAAGENLFQAHKTHYYQRLHQLGAGHPGTLLVYGVLIAGTCASAIFALAIEPAAGWQVFVAWTVAIGVVFGGIDYHWRKRSPPTQ